jgi:iron(III) transport system substrate-binding protein
LATYNTDMVSQDDLKAHLATWEGLSDPFWAGKILLTDPRNSSNQMSFMMMLRDTYGADWYKAFDANKATLVDTASAGSQQIAAGAFQILVPSIPSQSAAIRTQGAPVGLYLPGGVAHAPAQGMAVPVAAPHPNAGLLFLNWKISQEGQALTCKLGAVPVIKVDDADCKMTLPEKFVLGKDVISDADQKQIFDLLGMKP